MAGTTPTTGGETMDTTRMAMDCIVAHLRQAVDVAMVAIGASTDLRGHLLKVPQVPSTGTGRHIALMGAGVVDAVRVAISHQELILQEQQLLGWALCRRLRQRRVQRRRFFRVQL